MMQHRPGHCVTCDAALKDHKARSLGPPGDSDRFAIGPPPPLSHVLGVCFSWLTLIGVLLVLGTLGVWQIWRLCR